MHIIIYTVLKINYPTDLSTFKKLIQLSSVYLQATNRGHRRPSGENYFPKCRNCYLLAHHPLKIYGEYPFVDNVAKVKIKAKVISSSFGVRERCVEFLFINYRI